VLQENQPSPLERVLLQKASHSLPDADDLAGDGYDPYRRKPCSYSILIPAQSTYLPTVLTWSCLGWTLATPAGPVALAMQPISITSPVPTGNMDGHRPP
jgi:hypothetical protein